MGASRLNGKTIWRIIIRRFQLIIAHLLHHRQFLEMLQCRLLSSRQKRNFWKVLSSYILNWKPFGMSERRKSESLSTVTAWKLSLTSLLLSLWRRRSKNKKDFSRTGTIAWWRCHILIFTEDTDCINNSFLCCWRDKKHWNSDKLN